MNRCKMLCCLLLLLATGKPFAQKQGKDSLADDNMKQYHFRYYQLPGQPDSATFFRRADSAYIQQQKRDERKRKIDSLQRLLLLPPKKSLAYNQPVVKTTKPLNRVALLFYSWASVANSNLIRLKKNKSKNNILKTPLYTPFIKLV